MKPDECSVFPTSVFFQVPLICLSPALITVKINAKHFRASLTLASPAVVSCCWNTATQTDSGARQRRPLLHRKNKSDVFLQRAARRVFHEHCLLFTCFLTPGWRPDEPTGDNREGKRYHFLFISATSLFVSTIVGKAAQLI